jgi:hypothetical protein
VTAWRCRALNKRSSNRWSRLALVRTPTSMASPSSDESSSGDALASSSTLAGRNLTRPTRPPPADGRLAEQTLLYHSSLVSTTFSNHA